MNFIKKPVLLASLAITVADGANHTRGHICEYYNQFKGASKNEDFRARARKHRAQNRSVYDIHEDSSTGLTRLSCEKTIFLGALRKHFSV